MTEFYTVKRVDNSRLVRPQAPSRLREHCRRMAWAAGLASCALFYAWQHFQYIQLSYQIEDLQSRRGQSVELNQQLHLETAALLSPGRIDTIARQTLGLTVPVPGQVAPAQGPSDAVLAQARVPAQTPQP